MKLTESQMIRKPERLLLCIALPLMLLFCAAIWLIQGNVPVKTIHSDTGVWDLRDTDFQTTNVRFSGKVEYLPGELVTPQEFADREADVKVVDTCLLYTSRCV